MQGVHASVAADHPRHYVEHTKVRDLRLMDRGWRPGDEPTPTGSGPCEWCVGGDHEKCTGVGCYRCTFPHRKYGVGSPAAGASHAQLRSLMEGRPWA